MRQGRLCARDRARSRPRARLLWPRRGAAANPRRAVSGRQTLRWNAAASAEARASGAALVEAGLAELTRVPSIATARDPRRGQKLLLRGSAAPGEGPAYAVCQGTPVAVGDRRSRLFRLHAGVQSLRLSGTKIHNLVVRRVWTDAWIRSVS